MTYKYPKYIFITAEWVRNVFTYPTLGFFMYRGCVYKLNTSSQAYNTQGRSNNLWITHGVACSYQQYLINMFHIVSMHFTYVTPNKYVYYV